MKKKLVFLVIAAVLTTVFSMNIIVEATDEYDTLREKWKYILTGGAYIDLQDTDIAAKVSTITAVAQSYWDSMDKSVNRTYLWSDLASTTLSAQLTSGYERIKSMALAYCTEGSSLKNNTGILDDIISALDWMYVNRYNENKAEVGNWWDWEIGVPLALNDCVVLLYSQLNPVQITNYMNAVDHFTPTADMGGANRVWQCTVVGVRGVIVKDGSKIAIARNKLSYVFDYRTSGEGFYIDGSFIQHVRHPYTGGYGVSLVTCIADLLYMLDASTWEPTDPDKQNVFKWVYDSFEPLIYKGAVMDMTRGREIARNNHSDHTGGHQIIGAIIRLSQFAEPEDQMAFKRMVKNWVGMDTCGNYYIDNSINIIDLTKEIMNDTGITPGDELVGYKQFPSMDRAVFLRPGFGFGISMHSSRIYNYESALHENLKGWHTSDGMTYLYNNDLSQFNDNFWPTVDSYRLPGTTVLNSTGVTEQSEVSDKSWAGGTEILGTYGVSGMELHPNGYTLNAKKSWFMFDDEIVALGSGITSTDNRVVETIVENRMINSNGNNALTVNGTAKSTSLGWTENMSNVSWIHLGGDISGTDIGYYFPQPAAVNGLREAKTGRWYDINTRTHEGTSTYHTRNYMTLWFDHGTNPLDASYSYVLLPNKSSGQMGSYSSNPDITILENSNDVHAVKENTLNIIGANFWNDAVKTVDIITSNKKASVLVKEDIGNDIEISVSDPTQLGTVIELEINKETDGIISADPSVTVTQMSPTIKLSVDVSGSKGMARKIKLSLVPDTAPIIFSDDFNDGDANGWTPVLGVWSIVSDGTYRYQNSGISTRKLSVNGNSTWENYTVEAKLKIVGGGKTCGIVGRYVNLRNYYVFYYSDSAGAFKINKLVNGVFTELASGNAYTLDHNQDYTLKFEVDGTTLKGYVDGVEQVSVTDGSFGSGMAGVYNTNATVRFDDVEAQ